MDLRRNNDGTRPRKQFLPSEVLVYAPAVPALHSFVPNIDRLSSHGCREVLCDRSLMVYYLCSQKLLQWAFRYDRMYQTYPGYACHMVLSQNEAPRTQCDRFPFSKEYQRARSIDQIFRKVKGSPRSNVNVRVAGCSGKARYCIGPFSAKRPESAGIYFISSRALIMEFSDLTFFCSPSK